MVVYVLYIVSYVNVIACRRGLQFLSIVSRATPLIFSLRKNRKTLVVEIEVHNFRALQILKYF